MLRCRFLNKKLKVSLYYLGRIDSKGFMAQTDVGKYGETSTILSFKTCGESVVIIEEINSYIHTMHTGSSGNILFPFAKERKYYTSWLFI